jgi:glycosyltransferase involved in cell wall biosynthesis
VRITVICHYLPPKPGGIEHVVDCLAREYVEAGCEVTVVGLRVAGRPATSVASATYRRVALAGWNGLERFGVPVPVIEPISSWRRIDAAVRDSDAVHIHGITQPASMIALARACHSGKPVVVTEHVGSIPLSSAALRMVQAAAMWFAGRLVRRTARCVVVLNDRVAGELRALVSPVPVIKVPNGVDAQFFHPPDPGERDELRAKWNVQGPTVLAVARHVPKKGLDLLVRAAKETSSFDVVFVGPETEVLDAPEEGCRGLGILAQAQIAELYRAADLFVLPSQGEGLPLVVLEALASGLPVLLGDDPALRAELPEGPVRYFDVDDTLGLVDSIEAILGESKGSGALRTSAREAALARFEWTTAAAAYLGHLVPDATLGATR